MNESTLVEVFGNLGRLRALRALFAEPGRGFGQRELAAEAGLDPGSVARLLKRWTAAGLVTRRQQDGLPRYYASTDPALAPLVTLMQQDSALVRTLREALSGLAGVDVALIFGSVARGAAGAASDLDLLVLGRASELKLNAALKPVGRKLGRAVHATASTIDSFKNQLRGGESFALGVVQGPRVPLIGDLDAALLQATGL
ncbi:MAG: MarR family transcriptional regulator [Burkholderiaceae bacterium]|nr:MarR family transcriptional regulator [Burkholderiaceae bacterium]